MRLYHFTRRQNLGAILEQGITRGDAPLTWNTGINAPSLTIRPEPHFLESVIGKVYAFEELDPTLFDKTRIRIAVELPDSDPRLIRWKDFPKKFKVDGRFFRGLSSVAKFGTPAYDWYLFLGEIPTTLFAEVLDLHTQKEIHPGEWPAIIAEPRMPVAPLDWVRVLPIEEARRCA